MSNDINTVNNLIDLSADDDVFSPQTVAPPSSGTHFTQVPLVPLSHVAGVESQVNNPFDCVQEQATRPHDPFEVLSQVASQQLHHFESAAAATQAEVQTENLLCISDENIRLEDSQPHAGTSQLPEFSRLQVLPNRFSEVISSVSSIGSGPFSPCDDSAFTSRNDSSKTVNKAFITDNTISSYSEDSRTRSLMNKGFVGSCSSFDVSQSPGVCTPEGASGPAEASDSSGKSRSQKAIGARTRLLKLSLSNSTSNSPLTRNVPEAENSSPLSSVFSEAEKLAENFSSRFAIKSFDDSCDDIMSIKPNWVDSETDIDSDLEMLRIPILQEIPSPVVEHKPWDVEVSAEADQNPISCKGSSDLEALKEKVAQHRAENNNNHEIGTLIENLKHVIKDCANEAKKAEANAILESLSNLMNGKKVAAASNTDNLTPPPQPIIRQGTFDMDLRQKEELEERQRQEEEFQQEQQLNDGQAEDEPLEEQNISGGTHSLHSPEVPQAEVSDIVEQIGRILGNQNVNVVQANLSGSSGPGVTNPTYIVVMNTPIMPKQRPSIMPTEPINDGSPDLSQCQGRRRSQSLSLHDKSSQFTAPVAPSPVRSDCRTPARGYMVRRNSFSSATLSTPSAQPACRRSVYAASNSNTDTVTKSNQIPRRPMALETHHEKQQTVNHQPIPSMRMGGINFNAKKLKFKQSTESIVKACGPMKATIPVKKVAPLIVTTNLDSPIEDACRIKSVTSTPNVNAHPSEGYPNACSTPMIQASPIKRTGPGKSRYSFVGATSTSKQSTLAPSTSHVRRRTIGEMKSPKKVVDKSAAGISKPAVKTVKLPENYSKTLNKMAPATSRGTLRLTKPNQPAATTSQKNKENKLPRSTR